MNLLSLLNMIPGASSGVAQLQSKIGDFLKIPSRLQTDSSRVAKLIPIAQTKNDTLGISELSAIQNAIPGIQSSYNSAYPLIMQISGSAGNLDTSLLGNVADLLSEVVTVIASTDKVESTLSSYEGKYKGSLGSSVFGSLTSPSMTGILWIAGISITLLGTWFISRRRR
jgi:hypothetical protein